MLITQIHPGRQAGSVYLILHGYFLARPPRYLGLLNRDIPGAEPKSIHVIAIKILENSLEEMSHPGTRDVSVPGMKSDHIIRP